MRAHTLLQQGQQFGGQCRTTAGAPATAASVAATAAAAAMTAVAAAGTAPSSKRLSCKAAVCVGGDVGVCTGCSHGQGVHVKGDKNKAAASGQSH